MENNKQNINPATWVENYGDALYNYAAFRVNDTMTAQDLVQDTFVSAIKAAENFRGDSSEKTWLFSILKRKIIDFYRKSSTKNEINESQYELPFKTSGFFEGHWNTSRAPAEWRFTSDGRLNQTEFQAVMEYCLSLLPDKWKAVFVMRVVEEMESDEVCKEMNCSSSNLWVILHRARLKLRECIENEWING